MVLQTRFWFTGLPRGHEDEANEEKKKKTTHTVDAKTKKTKKANEEKYLELTTRSKSSWHRDHM